MRLTRRHTGGSYEPGVTEILPKDTHTKNGDTGGTPTRGMNGPGVNDDETEGRGADTGDTKPGD